MAVTYVGTYLGCKIYYHTPPDVPYEEGVYSSPCITGFYFKKSAVKKRICVGQGGTWDGTTCSFDEPEPEPEPDDWVYHSTYRGINIESYYDVGYGVTSYRAFLDGQWWSSTSLATVKGYIDNYLDPTTRIFIETYRGINIYYGPYADMYYYTIEGIERFQPTLEQARGHIDTLLEEPEPPAVATIVIDAPYSVGTGVTFTILGYVLDQYNKPMGGVNVFLYDNNSHFATVTTGSNGYYTKNTSISQSGIHTLAANAGTKWAYRDITITEAVGWLFIETYRDANIWLYQTAGEYWGYYFAIEGQQYGSYPTLQECRDAIDTLLEPVDIFTSLTIDAPASVEADETFYITGILYETDSGLPIPNQSINLSYNGTPLGGTYTGVDGDYLIQAVIPTEGSYTLTAAYAGTTTLGASEATSNLNTGALETPPILPLLGLGLIAFKMFKN